MANAGIIEEQEGQGDQGAAAVTDQGPRGSVSVGWKEQLPTDIKDSPLLKSYENTAEGMTKAFNGYLSLEKMLGREKIPVPKGDDDTEAWGIFAKAMGVPDKPEGYGLEDAKLPDNLKDMTMDKNEFAQAMLESRVPKASVNKLWKIYQQKNVDALNKAIQKQQQQVTEAVNQLKSEWGDAYNINVELGQQVINRFSTDNAENDWLTAVLTKRPAGIKFLARIGDQFAENKVTEFQIKKNTMSPEGAKEEIDRITKDLEGPYHNHKEKFTAREHQAAVDRVNLLHAVINRAGKA
jgi:hypothetical protein